jgi:endoglucanase
VYLDAGNPGWQTPATMGARLARAGVARAQGFALNVSNFVGTAENLAYGQKLSALVGGKHFVIDTGRNGMGGNGEWCNPAGRALGARPTTDTGNSLIDAYLWVKAPGESDGPCGGAAAAGTWMPEYALGLAQRAAF